MTVTGFINFNDAVHVVTDYIVGITACSSLMNIMAYYHKTNQKTGTKKTLNSGEIFIDRYICTKPFSKYDLIFDATKETASSCTVIRNDF
ncbi:hypothetical protein ABIE02_000222 [Leclercia sp. 1548]